MLAALFQKLSTAATQPAIAAMALLMFYVNLSVNAWRTRRATITKEFVAKAAEDSMKFTEYFIVSTVLVIVAIALFAWSFDQSPEPALWPVALFLCAIFLALILASVFAAVLGWAIVLGPAIILLSTVFFCTQLAKFVTRIGTNSLRQALVWYGIFGTMYLGLLSMPGLRATLGVPAICQ